MADIFETLAAAVSSIDLSILALNVADVTCEGTQAPVLLLMNLAVIVLGFYSFVCYYWIICFQLVTLLIGLDFFPFVSITINALIQQLAERMKTKNVPIFVTFTLGLSFYQFIS